MEVLAIGTTVTICGDIPATIRAITIYNEHWIKYLCVWWDERSRKEDWLSQDELKVNDNTRMTVSFQPPKQNR